MRDLALISLGALAGITFAAAVDLIRGLRRIAGAR
jgi:hypothetical protein